jgi:hypothetical protein
MYETNVAVRKLQLILQAWSELGHTHQNTPEYEALMNKIRVLSVEYKALVDARRKPEGSNESLSGRNKREPGLGKSSINVESQENE